MGVNSYGVLMMVFALIVGAIKVFEPERTNSCHLDNVLAEFSSMQVGQWDGIPAVGPEPKSMVEDDGLARSL